VLQFFNKKLEWLHKTFVFFMPIDTFKYLICGGVNTFLEGILYFGVYNYGIRKSIVQVAFFTISPHIMAFLIVFPFVFFSSFLLTKLIVFNKSNNTGKIQLFRFSITIGTSLIIQYASMKILVEWCLFYPTPSKILTSGLVALFTFTSHKYFSFRDI
jgi:putative flippase GtrA